jgi:hypothetical protein
MPRIINKVRYICNLYISFDNQVAILRGHIKKSQVSMASRLFDVSPEDGNLLAEIYVGLTNVLYFVNDSCALVGLT